MNYGCRGVMICSSFAEPLPTQLDLVDGTMKSALYKTIGRYLPVCRFIRIALKNNSLIKKCSVKKYICFSNKPISLLLERATVPRS